jgi:hypothetical protein
MNLLLLNILFLTSITFFPLTASTIFLTLSASAFPPAASITAVTLFSSNFI